MDFANFLPTHRCPPYAKVVSLLNQTVSQWPKGAAMLTGNRGIYTIKLWDKAKGLQLIGKKRRVCLRRWERFNNLAQSLYQQQMYLYAENFLTGKNKLRIDLDQGKDIPRDFHMQVETETGRSLTVSLRLFFTKISLITAGNARNSMLGTAPSSSQRRRRKHR